jgi:putative SOS response-associated peptidase YedK
LGPLGPRHPPIESCTILTTAAAESLREIHDRMPVMLDAASGAEWLAAGTPTDRLGEILAGGLPFPVEAYAVSTLVNSPAHDRPECLDRWEPEPTLLD